jgi:hypothetical protein
MITYYVLFFIHLGTRKVHIGGITPNPDQQWMAQIARNITDIDDGLLLQNNCKYLIHDRDSKFCEHFDSLLRSVQIAPVKLPRPPNLNAYAERFILSLRARVKSECLDRMILFGERALTMYSTNMLPISTLNAIIRESETTLLFLHPVRESAPKA